MKKKNKKENIDKSKDIEKVEMESYWDVFVRNYRNVPGFRSLVKLLVYILLIIIFIVVATSSNTTYDNNKNNETTNTTTKVRTSYQDILNKILTNDKDIYIEVMNNNIKYIIDGKISEGIFSGYYTTSETTKRFTIENKKIYELNLDERKENMQLFTNMNNNFIIPEVLIDIIKSNAGTKELQGEKTIYNYDITDNNVAYTIRSYIENDNLYKMEIKGDNISYNISYK